MQAPFGKANTTYLVENIYQNATESLESQIPHSQEKASSKMQ